MRLATYVRRVPEGREPDPEYSLPHDTASHDMGHAARIGCCMKFRLVRHCDGKGISNNTADGLAMIQQAVLCARRAHVAAYIFLMAWLGPATASPPTVEELFRDPIVRGVALSPDGARTAIAFRTEDNTGDVIAVVESEHLGKPDAVHHKFTLGKHEKISVQWLSWANPQRLLVGVWVWWNPPALSSRKERYPIAARIYAVNKDGSDPVVLFADATRMMRLPNNLAYIVDKPVDDPDHVLMPAWTGTSIDLFKVNVQTGLAAVIEKGTHRTIGWDAKGGRAVLRYDSNSRGTSISVFGRAQEGEEWSLLTSYAVNKDKFEWSYAGEAPGVGKIYVRTHGEDDKEGIYEFDIPTKTLGALVASVPDFDMSDPLVIDGQYAGASYVSDRQSYLFADPVRQKHFDGIDAYFGRAANVYVRAIDRSQTRMLLYVSGPRAPGDYYVYDIARKNLSFLMSARPWLEPERLAEVEAQRMVMRDGQTITSYLTWPAGPRTKLPLVVLPHGGPRDRDSLQFDAMAQAMASQGWLVVQPNFRGSSGYGRAFAEAGYRQWAGAMQDDVTDTVTHLIGQGVVDPQRVVILGGSYGGYSALAGAVVTPTLYRAAASIAGVTDLPELMKWHAKEDGRDSPVYETLVERIGDPSKDKAALEAASPRRRAAEIQIPVLLIHGKLDGIVPIRQSQLMAKALKKARKQVSTMEVIGEGHSGWSSENEIKAINAVIGFFEPHMKAPAP